MLNVYTGLCDKIDEKYAKWLKYENNIFMISLDEGSECVTIEAGYSRSQFVLRVT